MRPALTRLLICFSALIPCARAAQAGAWLYPEGKGQLIIATGFASARNAYDASGRLVATPPYRKFEARVSLEHGLTDWLTFVGEGDAMKFRGAPAPYDVLDLLISEAKAGMPLYAPTPRGVNYEGLGLGAVGARLRVLESGDYVVSVEGRLRAASPQARRFLDMRDPVQVDARLLIGRSYNFFGVSGFLDGQLGFRSGGQNGDEIRLDLTAGLRPFDKLSLMAQSFSAMAPRGGGVTALAQQKFQLSVVYDATPSLSVQLGGVAAPAGANAPAERGLITALWWRY
ncbi:MAG: hypothetical protein EKK29_09395 [Hyphomicrobiales bacterium]|nr:MAG: hypothetical protein EKK29_09395 [Hyphomicrobiales bacterium]